MTISRQITPFATPNITIGGIPIPAQSFDWSFVPGPIPFKRQITVTNELADRIRDLSNPTTISVRVEGRVGDREANYSDKYESIWIVEERKPDPYHSTFEIADRRVRWEGRRWTWSANITWRENAFGDGRQSMDVREPGILREQWDRFQEFRYLPWSKKKQEAAAQEGGSDGSDADRPWTALELLVWCLYDINGKMPAVIAKDNEVIQENLSWRESPVQQVISELCTLARVQIGVYSSGEIYVYPIEELVDANQYLPSRPPLANSPIPYFQDKSRIRPESCRIHFEQLREVAIIGENDEPGTSLPDSPMPPRRLPGRLTQQDFQRGRAVVAYNVVQIPRDVEIDGILYKRNQWVPMKTYLRGIGLDEEVVRRGYFSNLLAFDHAVRAAGRGVSDPPDFQRLMEAIAVKRCYRRYWQIDPYWVRRWESWQASRASIVDPVTRYALPSPVWADMAFVPTVFPPAAGRNKGLWKKKVWNYRVDDEDPNRENSAQPGTLAVVDSQLGIVQAVVPVDPDNVIEQIIPSYIENPPEYSPAAGDILWNDAYLSETHVFDAVVSVTPATGIFEPERKERERPSDKRYFTVEIPGEEGSKGPVHEWLMSEEVARFSTPLGEEVAEGGLPETPVNLAILVATAQAQASIVAHSYRDRWSGYAVFPGVDKSKLTLFGACRSIRVSFNTAQGLRTTYDMTEPPATPQLTQLLPPAVRQYIYRQLPQQA